jgi:hypothetical protein
VSNSAFIFSQKLRVAGSLVLFHEEISVPVLISVHVHVISQDVASIQVQTMDQEFVSVQVLVTAHVFSVISSHDR